MDGLLSRVVGGLLELVEVYGFSEEVVEVYSVLHPLVDRSVVLRAWRLVASLLGNNDYYPPR